MNSLGLASTSFQKAKIGKDENLVVHGRSLEFFLSQEVSRIKKPKAPGFGELFPYFIRNLDSHYE